MLNPFPELLTYILLSPFLLRVVLGFTFVNLGARKLRAEKARWKMSFETLRIRPPLFWTVLLGFIEIFGGLMFVAGFFTQIAALVFSLISLLDLYIEYQAPPILKRSFTFYLFLFTISLSLIFSGAGLFAFDLPL